MDWHSTGGETHTSNRDCTGALLPLRGQKSSSYRAAIRDLSLKLHKLIFCRSQFEQVLWICHCMMRKKRMKGQEGLIHIANTIQKCIQAYIIFTGLKAASINSFQWNCIKRLRKKKGVTRTDQQQLVFSPIASNAAAWSVAQCFKLWCSRFTSSIISGGAPLAW